MTYKDDKWVANQLDPSRRGNPTRSKEVNALFRRVKALDGGEKSPMKGRARVVPFRSSLDATAATRSPATPATRTARAATATGSAVNNGVQVLLEQMHTQNEQFIGLFGNLSRTLDQFKTTLTANNFRIMNEIHRLNSVQTVAAPAAVGDDVTLTEARQSAPNPPAVGEGVDDWWYVHDDGVRRRAPPSWTFPNTNLYDTYILWHCGSEQSKISSLKLFKAADVEFLGPRARANLSEIRCVVSAVDEEARKKGVKVTDAMTLAEAKACYEAGLEGVENRVGMTVSDK